MSKVEAGDAVELANHINDNGTEPGTVIGFWHSGKELYVIVELLVYAQMSNGCSASTILAHIDNVKKIEGQDND